MELKNYKEIVERLRERETKMMALVEQKEKTLIMIKREEINIKNVIESSVDSDGKKLYSNETKRQAAFMESVEKNEILKTMNDEVKNLEKKFEELSIEQRYDGRMLKYVELVINTRLNGGLV